MKAISLIICTFLSTSFAFGWSAPGHKAIALAARNMLEGTSAAVKIDALLEEEGIDDAAIWLDQVRAIARHQFHFEDEQAEQEAELFNLQFGDNGDWHFVNSPVGMEDYSLKGKSASESDIVHALEKAIDVMEGAPSTMTRIQAFRAILHLVGDIHQPMHCVTGFYDLSDMDHPKLLTKDQVTNPTKVPEDRGGNQLFFTKTQELHALWDLLLPQLISKDVNQLTDTISVSDLKNAPVTPGDYHHWPEIWASETMKQGKAAYKDIVYESAEFVPDPHHPESDQKVLRIAISLPEGTKAYKEAQKPRAEEQLRKAAIHLAQLLNKIEFK